MQFERNAQIQGHVERVVVRDEWASMCATRFEMQHWCFDFDVAVAMKRASETGDDSVAHLECAARFFVHDEVGVALAVPRVGIGEALPLVGQGA